MNEEEIFIANEKYIKATIRRKCNLEAIKNKHKLDYDDLYSFGSEGLLKGIRSYDSESSQFSIRTHFLNHIKWSIFNRIKSDSLGYKQDTVSLDVPAEDEESTYLDLLIDEPELSDEVQTILRALNVLKEDQEIDDTLFLILSEKIKGKTVEEIASVTGKNKGTISRQLNTAKAIRIKNRLVRRIREEDVNYAG